MSNFDFNAEVSKSWVPKFVTPKNIPKHLLFTPILFFTQHFYPIYFPIFFPAKVVTDDVMSNCPKNLQASAPTHSQPTNLVHPLNPLNITKKVPKHNLQASAQSLPTHQLSPPLKPLEHHSTNVRMNDMQGFTRVNNM